MARAHPTTIQKTARPTSATLCRQTNQPLAVRKDPRWETYLRRPVSNASPHSYLRPRQAVPAQSRMRSAGKQASWNRPHVEYGRRLCDCISDPWEVLCYCSQGPSDVSASQPSTWIGLELHDSVDAEAAAATDSFEVKLDAQQHDRQSDDETRGAFPYTKWHKIRYDI